MHTLIFDLSNVSYVCAARCQRAGLSEDDVVSQVYQATLQYMRSLYRRFDAKRVVFACDHSDYWRRDIFPDYKAQREMTRLKEMVRESIRHFKHEQAQHCLEVERCEADDVIFAVTAALAGRKTIISSDGDFVQLASDEVHIFNPQANAYRPPHKQPQFDLFVKCIRGDRSDNIPSAYPRVTIKNLRLAYRDRKAWEKLMSTQLKDGSIVRDNYDFNRTLIDFQRIPDAIKQQLFTRVDEQFS